jgi:FkbM family methyltransferase
MTDYFTAEEISRYHDLYQTEKGGLPWFRSLGNRPLYLFGAGQVGQYARVILWERGIRSIAGYLDNDPARIGTVNGLPVRKPEDPAVHSSKPAVLICAFKEENALAIRRQCEALGYECADCWEARIWNYPREDAMWLESVPEAKEAENLWEDEESTRTYRNRMRYMATRDPADMPPVHPDQYFPDFIPAAWYRSFADCGAYDGDTLADFRRKIGDDFDNYYAFEPDVDNCAKLTVLSKNDPRIHVYNAAVAEKTAMLSFYQAGHPGSVVAEKGGTEVPAHALDEVLAGKRVTYIKMDIEAKEPEALRGAVKIIVG